MAILTRAIVQTRSFRAAAAVLVALVFLGFGVLVGTQISPEKAGARTPKSPVNTVEPNYIKRIRHYTNEERKFVEYQAKAAVKNLPAVADERLKAAAVNHYIYNFFTRQNWAGANNAYEALKSEVAVCGGMVITMSEMLYFLGIESRLSYAIGGHAAHSMVEAYFSDGTSAAYDPYNGVIYMDKETGKILSLFEAIEKTKSRETNLLYVKTQRNRNGSPIPMASLENGYTIKNPGNRGRFTETMIAEFYNYGIQSSGFVDFIDIPLKPGDVLGEIEWSRENSRYPKPWLALGGLKGKDDRYLSWAYILGFTGLGYRVQHLYKLENLEIGGKYSLNVYVANAYLSMYERYPAGALPSVTIEPVEAVNMAPGRYTLQKGGANLNNYKPQVLSYKFVAKDDKTTLIAHAAGNLVISAIELR